MTNIEKLMRSELDRRYPQPAGEPDWDDALRRADDAVPSRRRRRPLVFGLAAAVLAAAAVSLTLVAPWQGSPGLLQQALAAIGSGRYVHAVFQSASITSQVDLASGHERPLPPLRTESVYDTKTGAFRARGVVDGLVFAGGGPPDPAISHFVTGYRTALANGEAHVVGKTTVHGQKAIILRFTTHFTTPDNNHYPQYEDVAVSTATHIPLRVTHWSPHVPRGPFTTTSTYRVLAIDSSDTRPILPKPVIISPPFSATVSAIGRLDASTARAALGHAPVWLGPGVAGTTLRSIELQRLTSTILRNSSTALGLQLSYRGPRGSLTVQEAAKPEPGYGFFPAPTSGLDLYPIPAEGQALVGSYVLSAPTPAHPIWHAQLRAHGLYVTIQSPHRDLVVTAARDLVPLP